MLADNHIILLTLQKEFVYIHLGKYWSNRFIQNTILGLPIKNMNKSFMSICI